MRHHEEQISLSKLVKFRNTYEFLPKWSPITLYLGGFQKLAWIVHNVYIIITKVLWESESWITAAHCPQFGRRYQSNTSLTHYKNQIMNSEWMVLWEKIPQWVSSKRKKRNKWQKDLPSSPFIIKFEYGAANKGYWSYDHMVLQLDDCVECLKCLHPEFDYLFIFDHSCGHDRQREDNLNVENMSKAFGSKQSNLQHALIKEERGYLGPFPWIQSQGCSTHDFPAIRSWTILVQWKRKGRKLKEIKWMRGKWQSKSCEKKS